MAVPAYRRMPGPDTDAGSNCAPDAQHHNAAAASACDAECTPVPYGDVPNQQVKTRAQPFQQQQQPQQQQQSLGARLVTKLRFKAPGRFSRKQGDQNHHQQQQQQQQRQQHQGSHLSTQQQQQGTRSASEQQLVGVQQQQQQQQPQQRPSPLQAQAHMPMSAAAGVSAHHVVGTSKLQRDQLRRQQQQQQLLNGAQLLQQNPVHPLRFKVQFHRQSHQQQQQQQDLAGSIEASTTPIQNTAELQKQQRAATHDPQQASPKAPAAAAQQAHKSAVVVSTRKPPIRIRFISRPSDTSAVKASEPSAAATAEEEEAAVSPPAAKRCRSVGVFQLELEAVTQQLAVNKAKEAAVAGPRSPPAAAPAAAAAAVAAAEEAAGPAQQRSRLAGAAPAAVDQQDVSASGPMIAAAAAAAADGQETHSGACLIVSPTAEAERALAAAFAAASAAAAAAAPNTTRRLSQRKRTATDATAAPSTAAGCDQIVSPGVGQHKQLSGSMRAAHVPTHVTAGRLHMQVQRKQTGQSSVQHKAQQGVHAGEQQQEQDRQEQDRQEQQLTRVSTRQQSIQQQQQQQERRLKADAEAAVLSSLELGEKFRVWPDLINSSSSNNSSSSGSSSSGSSADFDLVPASLCSAGVPAFMQLFQASTQPLLLKGKAAAAGRCKKGSSTQAAAAGGTRSRPVAASGTVATAAAAAAAAAATTTQTAARNAGKRRSSLAAELAALSAEGLWDFGAAPVPQSARRGGTAAAAAAAAAGGTGEAAGTACAGGGAAAVGADTAGVIDPEEAWYTEAEQQQLRFSWQDAPRGRFYRVEGDTRAPGKLWLVPHALITRHNLDSKLWHLGKKTRVLPVTDPCHPCLHNPVRPAILPPGQQHMLVAGRDLQSGELLGLYWGRVLTHTEDLAACTADLTCSYGMHHAYNMTVSWSEVRAGSDDLGLVVTGDSSSCRMCLVNDVKSWAADMEAQGWGPCPRAASGSCTCAVYVARCPNVDWRHFLYRSLKGDFIPAVVTVTKAPVKKGDELLTSYEESSAHFWDAIRGNLAQHCYCDTLAQKGREQTAALQQMLQCINAQPSTPALRHLQQVATSALLAAHKHDHKLDLLLAEAGAQAQPVSEEVAAVRRQHSSSTCV